jgi:hypothetical protein
MIDSKRQRNKILYLHKWQWLELGSIWCLLYAACQRTPFLFYIASHLVFAPISFLRRWATGSALTFHGFRN